MNSSDSDNIHPAEGAADSGCIQFAFSAWNILF